MLLNKTNIILLHHPPSIDPTDYEDKPCNFSVLMVIMKIQPAFLLIFGFVANLCSFIVLIQPRLRRRPTFSYLAFLSLSNALLSLVHAFFTIIGVYFDLTVDHLPLIFCRFLNRFSIDFLTHFSLYILTAVDLDRVRTVTAKTTNYQRNSRGTNVQRAGCAKAFIRVCLIVTSFAFVLFFLNLHWLTSYGSAVPDTHLNQSDHRTICAIPHINGQPPSAYGNYLTSILPIVELVLFGIVPFLISLITTIIILRHVSVKYTGAKNQNKKLQQSRRRMELHLSILLISLNCVFILFTTPHNIYNIYIGHLHHKLGITHETDGELCSVAYTQKSLDLLQQCYFMSTFFLYILTNKRFREEFYRLFKCFIFILCQNKNTNNSSISATKRTKRMINNINKNENAGQSYLMAPSRNILESRASLSDASLDDEPILMGNNS